MPLEILKTYPIWKRNINFSKILFFPQLLSSGTILTITFEMLGPLALLKAMSQNLPTPNNIFNCESRRGIKLITWLCVGLSHLRELKVKHSFQDTLTTICSSTFDVKPTSHYILHYSTYNDERHTLLSTINNTDCRLVDVAETSFILKLFSWCSD